MKRFSVPLSPSCEILNHPVGSAKPAAAFRSRRVRSVPPDSAPPSLSDRQSHFGQRLPASMSGTAGRGRLNSGTPFHHPSASSACSAGTVRSREHGRGAGR
jgi:hypothetical protein